MPCSCVILSEVGTLTLEFEELSKVTRDTSVTLTTLPRHTLHTENLVDGTDGLRRPPLPSATLLRGTKQPIRDISVRWPAALCFCFC